MSGEGAQKAKFSIPSILALVAAIGSFMTGAFAGFVLAMVAVAFGILGVVLSFSAKVRGGFMSTFAIFAGFLGLIAAVVKGIAWLL